MATTAAATATARAAPTAARVITRASPDRIRGAGPASIHWNPGGMAGVIVTGAGEGAPAGAGGLGVRRDLSPAVAVWTGRSG